MIQRIDPDDVDVVEEIRDENKPWRFRHAPLTASVIFSGTFVCLLWTAPYVLPLDALSHPALPRHKAALDETITAVFLVVVCGIASAIAANYIVSVFLRRTLKRAVPYPVVMSWLGLADRDNILGLIRLHELRVYVSTRQIAEETEDIPCRMIPLFLLPAYPPIARWALRLFGEIYFDLDEIEAVFGSNLDTVRRARPDMLAAEGSLTREAAAKLRIILGREEGNRGTDGCLENMQKLNDYYKLHGCVLTRLALQFAEKWEKRQTKTEKIVTCANIQRLLGNILEEEPALRARLLEQGVKGTPNLPRAMEDFFRHAMPDVMVDWRGGKPTLEYLIGKYVKGGGEGCQDDCPGDKGAAG